MLLPTDEFQMNSKCACIPKRIHKCIIMHECTSVIIRAFLDFFLKKKQLELYKSFHSLH